MYMYIYTLFLFLSLSHTRTDTQCVTTTRSRSVWVPLCICIYTYIYIHTHRYMYAHYHTLSHTLTHTHTYTQYETRTKSKSARASASNTAPSGARLSRPVEILKSQPTARNPTQNYYRADFWEFYQDSKSSLPKNRARRGRRARWEFWNVGLKSWLAPRHILCILCIKGYIGLFCGCERLFCRYKRFFGGYMWCS